MMDLTGILHYKYHGPLTECLLQFLNSLREDGWLLPVIQSQEDWLETLYDLWLQGTFINFRKVEIFIFGACMYAIMVLTTPTLFAN
jgi:hypothetical protein